MGSVASRQTSWLWLLKCGLTGIKIAKIANFWYNFAKKGYTPLCDFYKIWLGEGVPGLHLPAKFHHCGFKNEMWAYSPQSSQNCQFWYNFAKMGIPLKRFLPNLACERESQVRTLLPNFTVVAYKIWAYSPKIAKIGIFGINLPKRGIPF